MTLKKIVSSTVFLTATCLACGAFYGVGAICFVPVIIFFGAAAAAVEGHIKVELPS